MSRNPKSQVDDLVPRSEDFARIFEAAPNPYLLLGADAPRYTIAAVNEAYLRATGTQRAHLLGHGLFEVFPDNPHDAAATGVSDLRASLGRVLRDGIADVMGVQKYDIPLRDGSGDFEVRYWSPINTPVRRADGSIDFIIHHAEDVTEYVLSRERSAAAFAQEIKGATAKAELMEAEVLRRGTQLKATNRELKETLERLAEANAQLEEARRIQAEQLDVAIAAAHLGIWALDLETNALTTSESCRRDHGWHSAAPFTREAMLELIHPDDRAPRARRIEEALASGRELETEYRIIRPDGEVVWLLLRAKTEYRADGKPWRAHGVTLDITQRKRAEQRQGALIAELNHRVKNTLASVQSIALQTSITAPEPREFMLAFDGRIRALVGAHDLLTANAWQGAQLREVVARTLAPYAPQSGTGRAIEIEGPPVRFASEAAVTLHIALHELATNAAKYGALSTPEGSVSVVWTIDRSVEPPIATIVWRERNGPAVEKSTRRGFGSNFLQSGLTHEFGGRVTLDFAPEGLVCEMQFAMSPRLGSV